MNEYPSVTFLNDPNLDKALQDQIYHDGIRVHTNYYFVDWQYDRNKNIITSVRFESYAKGVIEIECTVLFFYESKTVNTSTFLGNTNLFIFCSIKFIMYLTENKLNSKQIKKKQFKFRDFLNIFKLH